MKNIFLTSERNLRNGWWPAVFLVGIFLILFPALLLADKYSFELTVQIQAIIILAVTMICQRFRSKSVFEVVGLPNSKWVSDFVSGSLIGAALMIVPALLLAMFAGVNWELKDVSWAVIGNGLYLFVFVAIAEELLFRGFLFQRLIQSVGYWPAQLIIGILFLLTHMGNPGMNGTTLILASANIFLASIVFGMAYFRTKSLAMPIGMHLFANFVQGPILGFGVSGQEQESLLKPLSPNLPEWLDGGKFGLEATVLCFVVLVAIALCFQIFKNPEHTLDEVNK